MRWTRKKKLLGGMALLAACLGYVAWFYVWPRYLLTKAEQAIAANELVRAEEILQRLHRLDSGNPRVSFLLARCLRRLQRPDQAEEVLRQARQLGYPESEWARELVLNESGKGFHPSSAAALLQLLKDNPDDIDVLQALGKGYASIHNWSQAEEYLTRWIELQPDNIEAWLERGHVRRAALEDDHGQNNDKAAADFQEVLHRVSDHFEARLTLAQCLLSDAKMAPAKREFLICKQLAPGRSEPLIGLAVCAVEEQNLEQAQSLLVQALKREPNSLTALAMQGDLCLRRQQYADAISYFQRILVLDPAHKAAHLKLAQAYRLSGMLTEAKNQEAAFQRLRRTEEKTATASPPQ
jgi:tetratricopeptide (TPR) repeat protein